MKYLRQLVGIRRGRDGLRIGVAGRPVSYTHLDVYKRQVLDVACLRPEQNILG